MIRFSNVYKTISKKPVVNGITFDFCCDKIYCINIAEELAHDTICSLLTEYAKPTIGDVEFYGNICPITDSYLNSHTMVIVYLEFIFGFAKKRNPNLEYSSIEIVLKMLELEDVKFQEIGKISEVQKDRVKIASGILSDCEIVVISKPFATLSVEIKKNFFRFLQIYKKGRTIIFLTRQGGGGYVFDEYIQIEHGRISMVEKSEG